MTLIPATTLLVDSVQTDQATNGLYDPYMCFKTTSRLANIYGDLNTNNTVLRVSEDNGVSFNAQQNVDTTYDTPYCAAINKRTGDILVKTEQYTIINFNSSTEEWTPGSQYATTDDLSGTLLPKMVCSNQGVFYEFQKSSGNLLVKKSINSGQTFTKDLEWTTNDTTETGHQIGIWKGQPIVFYTRNSGQIYYRFYQNSWSGEIKTPYTIENYAANFGVQCVVSTPNNVIHIVIKDMVAATNEWYLASLIGGAWGSLIPLRDAAYTEYYGYGIQSADNDLWYTYRRLAGSTQEIYTIRIASPYTTLGAENTLTNTGTEDKKNVHLARESDVIVPVLYETDEATRDTVFVGWSLNDAPLAPTIVTPGDGCGTATPIISWLFNDENDQDRQSAYEIEVLDDETSSSMWDTGKVVSESSEVTYAGTALVLDSTYKVRVKNWDLDDAEGAWSSYHTFVYTGEPAPTITTPTALQEVETDAVLIEVTDGTGSYGIDYSIFEILDTSDEVVYSSTNLYGTVLQHVVTSGRLSNNTTYKARITQVNELGVSGTSATTTFDVVYFSAPNASVTVTPNNETATNDAAITLVRSSDTNDYDIADRVEIYRKESSETTYEKLDRVYFNSLIRSVINDFEDLDDLTATNCTASLETSIKREGAYSVKLAVAAQTTFNLLYDPTSFPSIDATRNFAINMFFAESTNLTSVEVRLEKDASNYYTTTFTTDLPSSDNEWRELSKNLSAFTTSGTVTGTFSDVTQMRIIVIYGASTTTSVYLDYCTIDDLTFTYKDYLAGNKKSYDYKIIIVGKNGSSNTGTTDTGNQLLFYNATTPYSGVLFPVGSESDQIFMKIDLSSGYSTNHRAQKEFFETISGSRPLVLKNSNRSYEAGSISSHEFMENATDLDPEETYQTIRLWELEDFLVLKLEQGEVYFVSISGVTKRKVPSLTEISFDWQEIATQQRSE